MKEGKNTSFRTEIMKARFIVVIKVSSDPFC